MVSFLGNFFVLYYGDCLSVILLVGIVTGLPIKRESEGFNSFICFF